MRRLLLFLLLLSGCRVRETPPQPEEPPGDGRTVEIGWTASVGESVPLPPALLPDGRALILTSSGRLFSLDTIGRLAFLKDVGEPPTAGPVVSGDTIIVGTFYGNLYAYDTAGNLLFSDSLSSPIRGIAVGDGVFVVCEDGKVVRYIEGERVWVRYAGDNVLVPPSIYGDTLLVSTVSGKVLAYDRDGTLLWMREDLGTLPSSPTPSDTLVVVAFPDGKLLFITPSGYTVVPLPSGAVGEIAGTGGTYFSSTLAGGVLAASFDSLLWVVHLDSAGILTSPLLTEGGIIAITEGGLLYVVSYDGRVRDSVHLGGGGWLEPLPTPYGVLLVSSDGRTYGVRLKDGGLREGWPTFRGDPYRRGAPYGRLTTL